jgi:nicotinate-nucleotide pyrophosphorylase (carboxylating)
VPADQVARGWIRARASGCVAGLDVARCAFQVLDPRVEWVTEISDGAAVEPGDELARIDGPARAILTGERVALNFLGLLSGIATATRAMVTLAEPHGATIVCTRKTTPGLRALEKYAVRAGGGRNHRFGLDDAVLIKDNHIAVAGSVREAIERARSRVGHLVKIEVEVDTLEQLEQALAARPDVVMLDNFSIGELRRAVEMTADRGVVTEASGGVDPTTVAEIAQTGVDLISVGWLTHSSPTLDVGLDL